MLLTLVGIGVRRIGIVGCIFGVHARGADFAVLISLIHIMKRNYPNINLLFLDEILASIDSYGVYEMLNLIRNVVDELDLTVFVINHSELPKEMFDCIYSVNKVAGFSELEINPC